MSQADDLLDPFPLSEGQRLAMRLHERLQSQRHHELQLLLERVARHQQTPDDVRRLAVELGIQMTFRPTHFQD